MTFLTMEQTKTKRMNLQVYLNKAGLLYKTTLLVLLLASTLVLDLKAYYRVAISKLSECGGVDIGNFNEPCIRLQSLYLRMVFTRKGT